MPSKMEHLRKAEYNERFYESFDLATTQYLDWVVNGIFYSALHYIESYLATHNTHPPIHAIRNAEIRDDTNLGLYIFRRFNSLKDDSEDGRYRLKEFTPGEIQQHIIPKLYEIKEYLQKYIPEIRLA